MKEINGRLAPFSNEVVESAETLKVLIERFNEKKLFLRLFFAIDVLLATVKLQRKRNAFIQKLRMSGCKNPIPYLMEGGVLCNVREFACARLCFNRALEFLDDDNQDVRLRALMGRLECDVALGLQKIEQGEIEGVPFYNKIKEDCQTIRSDLGFARLDVQIDLMSRLAWIDTIIAMFVFRRERIIYPLKSHRRNAA